MQVPLALWLWALRVEGVTRRPSDLHEPKDARIPHKHDEMANRDAQIPGAVPPAEAVLLNRSEQNSPEYQYLFHTQLGSVSQVESPQCNTFVILMNAHRGSSAAERAGHSKAGGDCS